MLFNVEQKKKIVILRKDDEHAKVLRHILKNREEAALFEIVPTTNFDDVMALVGKQNTLLVVTGIVDDPIQLFLLAEQVASLRRLIIWTLNPMANQLQPLQTAGVEVIDARKSNPQDTLNRLIDVAYEVS